MLGDPTAVMMNEASFAVGTKSVNQLPAGCTTLTTLELMQLVAVTRHRIAQHCCCLHDKQASHSANTCSYT